MVLPVQTTSLASQTQPTQHRSLSKSHTRKEGSGDARQVSVCMWNALTQKVTRKMFDKVVN